jgi:hypothetical protein
MLKVADFSSLAMGRLNGQPFPSARMVKDLAAAGSLVADAVLSSVPTHNLGHACEYAAGEFLVMLTKRGIPAGHASTMADVFSDTLFTEVSRKSVEGGAA